MRMRIARRTGGVSRRVGEGQNTIATKNTKNHEREKRRIRIGSSLLFFVSFRDFSWPTLPLKVPGG
jgi:hypothetical protein